MTAFRLKHVHTFKDRHGRVRRYFRKPGFPQAPLPGLPGSREFMAAYADALARVKPAPGSSRTKAGTFNALVVAYYGSAGFVSLAAQTKATYRNIAEALRERAGDLPVATMPKAWVRKVVDEKAARPAAANSHLKTLRILMRFAVENGWRDDDPTLGVRRVRSKSEGFRAWSEADIAAFEARWPVGTRARLALALLLHTGQRRSDVVKLGPQHVRDGAIHLRQQKTGTRLALPIHPELAEALGTAPKDRMTFLATQGGAAFSANGFAKWFVECARAAGLPPGLAPHGLRKACARRLAESGCSTFEIASVTGHQSLKETERYTRSASQEAMAQEAMRKVQGRARKTGT